MRKEIGSFLYLQILTNCFSAKRRMGVGGAALRGKQCSIRDPVCKVGAWSVSGGLGFLLLLLDDQRL